MDSTGDTSSPSHLPNLMTSAVQLPRRRRVVAQRAVPAGQDLQALQAVTDTALSHLALDDLLAALLERITDILHVDNAAVLLLDSREELLTIQAVRGLEEPVASLLQVPVGQGFAGRIAATREALVVDEVSSFPVVNPLLRERLHSLAGVPLVLGEQALGVLHIGTVQPRHFTDADVHLLQQVADRMALAIDRARLYQAEQQARALLTDRVAQLEAVMEAVPHALAVYDTFGQVLLANSAYTTHMPPGQTLAERIQHIGGVFDVHGTLLDQTQWPQTRALHGEVLSDATAMELAVHTSEREPAYSRVTAAPLRDRDGNIIGTVTLNQNISEQKRLERDRRTVQAEAERQAAQLEAIFEAMADGVVVFDHKGDLVRENAAHRLMLGVDMARPDATDISLSERKTLFTTYDEQGRLLGPGEGPLARALQGEVVSGGKTMHLHARSLDGREVEMGVSAAPLRDQGGQVIGAVGVYRDQTVQKRLEHERTEQAEQLDRIFESITDGLIIYNREGQPVRLNTAAQRILGLDAAPPDYSQLSVHDRVSLYRPRDEQGRPLAFEEWPIVSVLHGKAAGVVTREQRLRTLDGRDAEVIVSVAPLRDREGRLSGAVAVLHDQTEQKRLALEREEAGARELAAQQVTEQMSAFLAIASHDIRSPLTVAAARVQLADRLARRLTAALATPLPTLAATAEPPQLLADEVVESLQRAHAGLKTLQRLVNVLFDVTQAQTQQLVLELARCDLGTLVREHVAAEQVAPGGHSLQVQVPEHPVLVEADADRLGEVLTNFLSNALKYSPAHQPVIVQLEVVDQQAVVSVIDQGPGIAPEEQSRIWEMFYRSPTVPVQPGNRTTTGSLGLGLHICKQLVELHPGGSIGVESTVGHGSTFWFRLPLAS